MREIEKGISAGDIETDDSFSPAGLMNEIVKGIKRICPSAYFHYTTWDRRTGRTYTGLHETEKEAKQARKDWISGSEGLGNRLGLKFNTRVIFLRTGDRYRPHDSPKILIHGQDDPTHKNLPLSVS